ncbi:hypothetical protein E4U13_005088 [Claviceps humidiphila]|uniref:Geranylgeranyl pyrophosphate synthetase n=1 Tax=Claviceps humidiphila TaxID=1294629 RepID=A0A9P7PYC1_9HYPO|nr:hypothetical protein E4U13_005088 [Claviceps humidiphila]
MVSNVIGTISRTDLEHLEPSGAARITGLKCVSSYSWIDAPTPTIAVPGSPPLWTPSATDVRLPKDFGLYNISENAVRLPRSPMAPIFTATFTTNPSFDVRPMDVISDRHNIRKLLSFIDPGSERYKNKKFNLKLEVVRNTLLLSRHEKAVTCYFGRNIFHGHGHEFEKAYTTNQIHRSAGHYRIISYCFCGLNFLIRHETDGFVSPNEGLLGQSKSPFPSSSRRAQPTKNTSLQNVTVLHKGNIVPLESTLEIKTCNKRRLLEFRHVASQLWVSQTPQLVRAYYDEGCFSQPQVEDVGEEIREWERNNQKNLRILGALIQEIIRVMKGCGGRGMLRYDVASASLIISSDKDQSDMLPKHLYSKWDEQKS